jgi:hypothetical protein
MPAQKCHDVALFAARCPILMERGDALMVYFDQSIEDDEGD